MNQAVLDACCGSRMMWFDRSDPRAVFVDQRSETITVTDNSRGNASGQRVLRIEPDFLMDFRALTFPDGAFKIVAFDPPHLVQAGPRSWLAAKYGRLGPDWREDLRQGFAECFRAWERSGHRRPETIDLLDDQEAIEKLLREVLETAMEHGYVITVENKPRMPLAMGNHYMALQVRPARNRYQEGGTQ